MDRPSGRVYGIGGAIREGLCAVGRAACAKALW